jgi:hypothetical protein
MEQISIPFSDFRTVQKAERRRWTITATGSAVIGGAGAVFCLFGPVPTDPVGIAVTGLVAGTFLGISLVSLSQVFRIRLAEIMLDEAEN